MCDSVVEKQTYAQALQQAKSIAASINNLTREVKIPQIKRPHNDNIEPETTKIARSGEFAPQNNVRDESVKRKTFFKSNSIVIKVSHSKVGLIIGKGGETIKRLQEESGTKIYVEHDDPNSLIEREIRIKGDHSNVERAKQLINELTEDKQEYKESGKSLDFVVTVPQRAVGLVIGKGGAMINKLRTDSGAKIEFRQNLDQTPGDRACYISGSEKSIERARILINNIIKSVCPEYGNSRKFTFTVSTSKCGIIIGKRGETIKHINKISGAHCELDKSYQGVDRVFIIQGDKKQIEAARNLITKRIHINIDLVPTLTGNQPQTYPDQAIAYNPSGYNQNWAMPSFNQQWGAGATSQNEQIDYTLQWAEYFRQVGMQPQHQVNQLQGSLFNTVPVACGGLQQDYTAQWIEYYRKMGDHDKANAIVQRIRTEK